MNETLLKLFSLGSLVMLAGCVVFLLLELFKVKNPFKTVLIKFQNETIFFFSLIVTVLNLLLSSYFQFVPCELCWYQRVFLFVIPFISFVATVRNDTNGRVYVFVLSALGLVVALYHSLLQAGLFQKVAAFCNPNSAIECAVPYFTYYGFVTIPFMSCVVFLSLMIASYVYKK